MTAPVPQPGILDIAPYVGGKSSAAGAKKIVKLSSNESALGPSPRAIAAFQETARTLHRYPDGGASRLRDALAEHHGLEAAQIVCGNGSDELISLLVSAYCGPGNEVLYSQYGFLMYGLAAKAHGAKPVIAPESAYRADVDALLAAVSERTRVVFLANPNNPTGSYLSMSEVRRLRAGLPDDALLVLDSAYAEFVTRNDYSAGTELVRETDNTVMTRTFSKIYGLAALRVGWAYCPENIADVLNRVRGPFNVNAAAQAAAVAALEDDAHVDAARTHNDAWLPWLTQQIGSTGLQVFPSLGNFLLVRFGPDDRRSADAANDFLIARGIIPRDMKAYGLPDCLRITVGTEEENRAVAVALAEFMGRRNG